MGKQSKREKMSNSSFVNLSMFGVLVAVFIIASLIAPRFFNITNIANIISQQADLIIVGVGVTFLLITGHFDLSVGGIIAFAGVLIAYFSQNPNSGSDIVLGNGLGVNYWIGIVLTLIACLAIGAINSFFIVKMGVASVIITLGTMTVSRGIAMVIAKGALRNVGLPDVFKELGKFTIVGPINLPVVIMIFLVIGVLIIEKKTLFGKRMYYIGSNKDAAQLSGVAVGKHLTILYMVSAFFAGLTGIIMASKFNAGIANAARGYEFDALVVSVLGGTSISGGFGSVICLVIGAYIVGILSNTLNLLGLPPDIQTIVKGAVIVLAIVAQRFAISKREV